MGRKVLIPLLLSIIICKQCNFTKALIGENVRDANEREFSSTVAILRVTNDSRPAELNYACAGTLITNRDVITTAHCLANEQRAEIKVIVGMNDLRQGIQHFPEWWITFDEWAEEFEIESQFPINDICILRLTINVTLINIIPARIRRISRRTLCREVVEVAGWGQVEGNVTPRMMKTAALTVLNHTLCLHRVRDIRGHFLDIRENHLCTAANPYALVRPGDSGDPLFVRKAFLTGITRAMCPNMDPINTNSVNLNIYINYYIDFIAFIVDNYN